MKNKTHKLILHYVGVFALFVVIGVASSFVPYTLIGVVLGFPSVVLNSLILTLLFGKEL